MFSIKRSQHYMRNTRNRSQLTGSLRQKGYEVWRHFFWATDIENGERCGFIIDYMLLNPAKKKKKPVPLFDMDGGSFAMVRATMLTPVAPAPAEFFSDADVEYSQRVLSLRFGENICLEDGLVGNIVYADKEPGVRYKLCTAGSASWQLQVDKHYSYGFSFTASSWLSKTHLKAINWHVGGLQANYEGHITVNSREFRVHPERSFGFQDKVWGYAMRGSWLKIYSGKFNDVLTGESLKETSLTVFQYNRWFLGWQRQDRWYVLFVHEGKMYDFSSTLTQHNIKEVDEKNNRATIILSASNVKHQISITLHMDNYDQAVNINYPKPEGGLLTTKVCATLAGVIELQILSPLVGWESVIKVHMMQGVCEQATNDG
jgi:tocopherol cyclase